MNKYSKVSNLDLANEYSNLNRSFGEHSIWVTELDTKIICVLRDISVTEDENNEDPLMVDNRAMRKLSGEFIELSERKHVYQSKLYELMLNLFMLEREMDQRSAN